MDFFPLHKKEGLEFRLRPFAEADAAQLSLYANNEEIARNLTNAFPHPYTLENAQQFIAMTLSAETIHVFGIEVNGQIAGGMGIHPQSDIMCKNAELGYWLAQPFWGRGITSALVKDIITYGFQHFDITRIFARPFGSNEASQRVLEKVGFVLEARIKENIYKWDRYEDELIYGIRKSN
jgi:RimJ/RimL family protein N-acetyltransferase